MGIGPNARPHLGEPVQVRRRARWIGRIEHGRRNLVAAQVMLVGNLVARSAEDQPSSSWEAGAVAEYQVYSPPHPGDEVVHVAFEASVVATGEDQPAIVVDR